MVVLPYLRSIGVRRLDRLMASHGDNDHVGGVASVLAGMPVVRTVAGPTVQLPSTERCVQGQRWEWDGVRFEVLHPPAQWSSGENDSSCVLRVVGANGSALIAGDIERRAEEHLLRENAISRTDVVVIPHHGSRTSSTAEWVRATSPRIAVVSAGHGNRWGFPKQDVIARWTDTGARVLNTAHSGAVEIDVGSGEISAAEFRRERRSYWRQ
jgi:competence protein ComEC